ncbi:Fic family protein [Candidatus Bathyarchaeota archaeon]|nr:Fic family protein [Candidatus Bathyarchaeota archaeon]
MNLLDGRIHDRILEQKKRLDSHRPLPPSVLDKIQQQMEVEYIYNSNAIEGNTLKLRETQLILERGITIGGKSLREHLEVRNHPKAIEYIQKLTKRSLRVQDILLLHQIIMKGIEKDAGRFRTAEIRIAGADFTPPPAYDVPHLITQLVDWYNMNPDELRPIELAAILHYKLVYIHPFHDGNGRVSRLLMNFALIRNGYPLASILNVDRKKYYDVLKKADNGILVPFVSFVAASVERSLGLYLRALEPSKEEDELLTLAEASKISSHSQEYLSLLARKRRIAAMKVGRRWMITKKELRRYAEEVKLD